VGLLTLWHKPLLFANLECIFLVEVTRQNGERYVDDDEGEDRCPDCHVFDQFLAEVFEHRGEVDGVDWSDEAGSETAEQVAAESHALRSGSFNLQIDATSTGHGPRCSDDICGIVQRPSPGRDVPGKSLREGVRENVHTHTLPLLSFVFFSIINA